MDKVQIKGISSLSLPRQIKLPGLYFFTAFSPGTKDKPARATFYQYTPGMKADAPPLLSKSLFQAEEMQSHWNALGDGALITLQTSVDTSGQSYYGSSQLFLLRKDSTEAIGVPLPQEGTVLNVGWMPDPSKPPSFVVLAGKMPAMASLHHGITGAAKFIYGNAHRNTVAWAPHGRFLCLAGFGNLAGGMSFWDNNKNKLTSGALNLANQVRAEAVVGYGWSADSRVFLCSTCSPRMNVDNGVRLFRYNGDELKNLPWDNQNYRPNKLLEAVFVPAPTPETYPDRPQSPLPELGVGGTGAAASVPAVAPAPKPSRYVPPSARNRATGGTSLAERMSREKDGHMKGASKVVDKPKNVQGKVMVGMTPVDAGKSKSAVKREKQKKKKEEQADAAANAFAEAQAAAAAAAATPVPSPEASIDPAKRARKLNKTLKQIEDLKTKDPGSLNDDQKSKVASEAEVWKELADLGL
jgi:translation initiation factor 2A